ncbi:MAG: ABC transporter substrate-binding protein [Candidatus Riflebacteria bacterium]|nr:ABC transporter substrate-binding protein [Candidatus Riflebacteria bacterium]
MKNKIHLLIIVTLLIFTSITGTYANNRIISLIPSSTEMLFALGFDEEVVAVSKYCNYPEGKLTNLPRIGDQNLDIERILSLKPTILVDTNGIHKRYEEKFKKLNLNYVNLEIKNYSDIPIEAARLALMLDNPTKAYEFIEKWNNDISQLQKSKENSTVKVYIEIWNNPVQAVGRDTMINSMIEIAGGNNALEKQKDYPVVNTEILMLANPDLIILAYPDASIEDLKKRPGWKNIKAVKNNNIFKINQDIIVRPGPRNIDAIKEINNYINKVKANENN